MICGLSNPRIYYQYDEKRLSVCTLQFHMLLHIADSIEQAGPIWVYWVFAMERMCGRLQRAVRSLRHPYASMYIWALDWEQLKVVKNRFDLHDRLSTVASERKDGTRYPQCKSLIA
jgi:hypothetical protein